jgi:hypothetical protein
MNILEFRYFNIVIFVALSNLSNMDVVSFIIFIFRDFKFVLHQYTLSIWMNKYRLLSKKIIHIIKYTASNTNNANQVTIDICMKFK